MTRQDRAVPITFASMAIALLIVGLLFSASDNGYLDDLAGALLAVIAIGLVTAWLISLLFVRVSESVTRQRVDLIKASGVTRTADGTQVMIGDKRYIHYLPSPPPILPAATNDDTDAIGQEEAELYQEALRFLTATINHANYGPDSDQLMTYTDGQKSGTFTRRDDQKKVVKYLAQKWGVVPIDDEGRNNKTMCKAGETVLELRDRMQAPILARAIGRLSSRKNVTVEK